MFTKIKINKIIKSKRSLYAIIPIATILLFLILFNFPIGIFPDIVYLSENQNTASYLSTILSSISSLTGLLIAILIIAFEYYKSNLNKIYLKYFLDNSSLIFLINSYIFVFVFSSLALLLQKNSAPSTNGELTVGYLSIITFILLIPMTFYSSFLLVKSLSINDIIDEQLKRLSFDKVFLLNSENIIFPTREDEENKIPITKIVDNDTLEILHKLLINQLSSDNTVKAQIILNKVSDKFVKFILDKNEYEIKSNTVFHQFRFAHFLLSLIDETKNSPKLSNRLILERELEIVSNFYSEYNKKKLKLSYLEPFRKAYFTKLLKIYKGEELLTEKILDSIGKIINDTISNNLPPEESIMYLDATYRKEHKIKPDDIRKEEKEEDFEHSYSWEKFAENYPKYFMDQMSIAIENKNERVFLNILSIYRRCVFYWHRKSNKENRHIRSRWIIMNFMQLVRYYEKAIEKNIIFRINGSDLIFDSDMTNLFKHNEVCARRILVDYLQFIIWLNKQGKLNYEIYCGIYSMGDWGSMYIGNNLTMLGSYFAENYHTGEQYINGFKDVIATIEIIFDDFKKGIVNEEINLNTMLSVLVKIKENYIRARKKQSKSQRVLRRINKITKEINTASNING